MERTIERVSVRGRPEDGGEEDGRADAPRTTHQARAIRFLCKDKEGTENRLWGPESTREKICRKCGRDTPPRRLVTSQLYYGVGIHGC